MREPVAEPPPKVSVVLPTYKRMEYLREAIESALGQTFEDFELIISDNAMSEEVAELARSYGDPRIRYRHNGANIGSMRNALAAFKSARGTYIGTLHDDDAWEPRFLEVLVPPLEADESLTLSFSDHYIMDGVGHVNLVETDQHTRIWRREGLQRGVHRPFAKLALVDRAVPVAMACVFRKSAVDWDDFPDEIELIYDFWLAYLLTRDGAGGYYSDERLTRYRHHGESLTSTSRSDRAFVYCYSRMLADDRLRLLRRELRRESAAFHSGLGISLLMEDKRAEARPHLLRGLTSAARLRSAAGLALSYVPFDVHSAVAWSRRAHASRTTGTRRF